jgi:dTMP kinase
MRLLKLVCNVPQRVISLDRFEQEKVAFFDKVRAVYQQRAQSYPQRYRRIDANVPLEQVQAQLKAVLSHFVAIRTL